MLHANSSSSINSAYLRAQEVQVAASKPCKQQPGIAALTAAAAAAAAAAHQALQVLQPRSIQQGVLCCWQWHPLAHQL